MPTPSSLAAPQAVTTTTYGAASDAALSIFSECVDTSITDAVYQPEILFIFCISSRTVLMVATFKRFTVNLAPTLRWPGIRGVASTFPTADSRLAPSQWETSLQSNAVSHWLGANLESALYTCKQAPLEPPAFAPVCLLDREENTQLYKKPIS